MLRDGLFSQNWDGTILYTITKDLFPLIDFYCKKGPFLTLSTTFGHPASF